MLCIVSHVYITSCVAYSYILCKFVHEEDWSVLLALQRVLLALQQGTALLPARDYFSRLQKEMSDAIFCLGPWLHAASNFLNFISGLKQNPREDFGSGSAGVERRLFFFFFFPGGQAKAKREYPRPESWLRLHPWAKRKAGEEGGGLRISGDFVILYESRPPTLQ